MRRLQDFLGLGVLFAILALWEGAARSGVVTPDQLPAPSAVAVALYNELRQGDLAIELARTARRVVLSFLLASVVSIPLGFALGRWELLHAAVRPLIEFLRPLPVIAILPIAVFLLGLGDRMAISVIAFGSGWVILLHAMDGIRAIDPVLIDTAKTFQISARRQFFTIILPAASPHLFTGLRLGLGIAVIVTVVVEFASGYGGGLGDYIDTAQGALRIPETYAGVALIGLLGYAIGQCFLWAEHRVMAWHRGYTGRGDS
jgi:ABC-type nitrate/sulfonate/bicarbonate transport system permease component